jgi:hypothetical protein
MCAHSMPSENNRADLRLSEVMNEVLQRSVLDKRWVRTRIDWFRRFATQQAMMHSANMVILAASAMCSLRRSAPAESGVAASAFNPVDELFIGG